MPSKQEILDLVAAYCGEHHKPKTFLEGDRITYAGRVFDEKELCNLVDSALDFWLTAGKYTEQFERGLGREIGRASCRERV